MDLEGAFLDSEGALLHSLPKSGCHGPSVPTSPMSMLKRSINHKMNLFVFKEESLSSSSEDITFLMPNTSF